MINNNYPSASSPSASSQPPAVTSSSPSIAHMRSIAAKEGGGAELTGGGGCVVPINTSMGMRGGDVYRPRPQKGILPMSISRSICTLAMKMVGDDTIRARVADLIPDDFLMVEEVNSSSSSSASPPPAVQKRAAHLAGGAFAFANTQLDPHEFVDNSASHHNITTPDVSPLFDDDEDSYSEWIAIRTPSSTDGGLQFPSPPTPTTTIVAPNTDNAGLAVAEGRQLASDSKHNPDAQPPSSPSLRRVYLRRNVSSLLELNFSLRTSPLPCHQPRQQNSCDGYDVWSLNTGNNEEAPSSSGCGVGEDYIKNELPVQQPPQRVLSIAVAPPTRLGGEDGGGAVTRSQSARSDTPSSPASSWFDPDLLTSRPHSLTSSTLSATLSDEDCEGEEITPPRTPLPSNTSSPLKARSDNIDPASSREIGSWFESLFNVVLRSVTSGNDDSVGKAPPPSSTSPAPVSVEGSTIDIAEPVTSHDDSNKKSTDVSSPLPYFPPNTPPNLLERQFIIAAAYVLNAALIAGIKSADYILGQQTQHTRHHHDDLQQVGGDASAAGLSISAARLKANRIIQNFVEAAVDVIQQAWFTTHNYG